MKPEDIKCPHCGSSIIIIYDEQGFVKRYECAYCGRTLSASELGCKIGLDFAEHVEIR